MDTDKPSGLPAEIAELFNSDSESEEFDGFVPECAVLETRQWTLGYTVITRYFLRGK